MKNRGSIVWLLCVLLLLSLSGCRSVTDIVQEGIESPDKFSSTHLTGVMTAEDLSFLDRFPNLKSVDLTGSTCADAIYDYAQTRPEVIFTYTVTLDCAGESMTVPNHVRELQVDDCRFLRQLAYESRHFAQLQTIVITDGTVDPVRLSYLTEAFPEVQILFRIPGLEETVSLEVRSLVLPRLNSEDVEDVAGFLSCMPELTRVEIEKAALPDAGRLQQSLPGVEVLYSFELFGQNVSLQDEKWEFVLADIGNEGLQQFYDVLPWMPRLTSLRVEQCGVDSENMARLRDDFPQIDVVWRIFFGPWSCMTDAERIFASGSITDADTCDLKYCTRMKYIDIGHTSITNIDFVSSMPQLEVAVFAITNLKDISPLANCPQLEYLEIFTTQVSDLSPLAACTGLQHLNISNLSRVTDLSPLYGLTQLKRLRCTRNRISTDQEKEIQTLMPDCEMFFTNADPTGDNWRYNKDGSKVERYDLLGKQLGYDELDYSWW